MFERIIVGVDAEGAADHAVVAAGRLAERCGGNLEYVHSIPVALRAWSGPAVQAWEAARESVLGVAREACAQRVDAALEAASVKAPKAADNMKVVEGNSAYALLEQRPGERDLVVLGGHRDLGMLHLGSTARGVLGGADSPVWIQNRAPTELRRVIAAVDLSGHSEVVADRALQLAEKLDAELLLLHSFEVPYFRYGGTGLDFAYTTEDLRRDSEKAFEVLAASVRERRPERFEARFVEGPASATLLETSEPGDVLVMGTHGHSGMLRTVLGSHAYRVVKRSEQPVLVVPQLDAVE